MRSQTGPDSEISMRFRKQISCLMKIAKQQVRKTPDNPMASHGWEASTQEESVWQI